MAWIMPMATVPQRQRTEDTSRISQETLHYRHCRNHSIHVQKEEDMAMKTTGFKVDLRRSNRNVHNRNARPIHRSVCHPHKGVR